MMTRLHLPLSILRRCGCILATLILSSASLAAHDMWIEPTAFLPDAGKIIGLKLRVGQDLLGDPIPRDPSLIDQFISVDSTGRKPVVGRDGADPAGLVRVAAPGLLIVGYKSNPSPVVLPAAKFNQYLTEEGLEAIAELRARRRQTGSDAREVFSRCAKSLISSGTPTDTEADRALGFPLELVTLKNPYTLRAGEDLPVSLMYEGHPLQGALVVAMNRANPSAKLTARTDKNGRVTFKLPESGMWLIKSVHMIPAAAGVNADWASFWASVTFEMRNPTTGAAAR
jgi:uncharacterized GH25 family protein